MGSLDYVSANAGAAISFVTKQPALMLDDIFNTFGASDPNFSQDLAKANTELGLDIRNDLASALGGEMTFALDGPVLPTPSWKAIIEVNDSGALQVALDKLVQAANREAQKSNQPGLTTSQEQVGGRTFYTIQAQTVWSYNRVRLHFRGRLHDRGAFSSAAHRRAANSRKRHIAGTLCFVSNAPA